MKKKIKQKEQQLQKCLPLQFDFLIKNQHINSQKNKQISCRETLPDQTEIWGVSHTAFSVFSQHFIQIVMRSGSKRIHCCTKTTNKKVLVANFIHFPKSNRARSIKAVELAADGIHSLLSLGSSLNYLKTTSK